MLDHATVEVRAGRRIAVLGANGSGKTTLLRTLAGALRPTAGQVLWHGTLLHHSRSRLNEHRQRVQFVGQDPDDQLVSADVRRDVSFGPMNLGLPVPEVRARVEEALALLDLLPLADRPVHHLSYGQRKRVALAGAMAMRPAVMLLDEPTAGSTTSGCVMPSTRSPDSNGPAPPWWCRPTTAISPGRGPTTWCCCSRAEFDKVRAPR